MSSALQSQEGLLILAELAEKYLTCQVIWLHYFAYPLRSTWPENLQLAWATPETKKATREAWPIQSKTKSSLT